MLSMKQAVPLEVAKIKSRTLKSLAMRRITPYDSDYIVKRLDEIEARVILMNETIPGEDEHG